MEAVIWVCPTAGCGNYFGSSSTVDLAVPSWARTEDRHAITAEMGRPYRHTRANCPDCRARGVEAERLPVRVSIPKPNLSSAA